MRSNFGKFRAIIGPGHAAVSFLTRTHKEYILARFVTLWQNFHVVYCHVIFKFFPVIILPRIFTAAWWVFKKVSVDDPSLWRKREQEIERWMASGWKTKTDFRVNTNLTTGSAPLERLIISLSKRTIYEHHGQTWAKGCTWSTSSIPPWFRVGLQYASVAIAFKGRALALVWTSPFSSWESLDDHGPLHYECCASVKTWQKAVKPVPVCYFLSNDLKKLRDTLSESVVVFSVALSGRRCDLLIALFST
jgi:hypothetical protein